MKRYIRLDKLRPLDVILSKPKRRKDCKSSDAIAFLTSKGTRILSKFSHASIVITPFILIEAIEKGTHFRGQEPTKCIVDKDSGIVLLKDVHDYENIAIYRHKELVNIDADETIKKQIKAFHAVFKYFLLEYPTIDELRNNFKDRSIRVKIADLLVGKAVTYYSSMENKIVTGPFCSQLVCELFNELHLKLFKESKEIDFNSIAPIDLTLSELTPVKESIVEEENIPIGNNEKSFINLIKVVTEMLDVYQNHITEGNRQKHFLFVELMGKIIEPLLKMDNISNTDKSDFMKIWNKEDAVDAINKIKCIESFAAILVSNNHVLSVIKLVNDCFTKNCNGECLKISDCKLVKDGFKKANKIMHDKIHSWAQSSDNSSQIPPFEY